MIIVEGPDLVGKTTLAKYLESAIANEMGTGHVYQHLSKLPAGFDFISGHLALVNERSVWDRFHMSELVYSQALRGGISMHLEEYAFMDCAVRMSKGLVVLLTGSEELIRERHSQRDDHMFTLEQILQVNEIYIEIADGLHDYNPHWDIHYHVSTEGISFDDCLDRIFEAYWTRWRIQEGTYCEPQT